MGNWQHSEEEFDEVDEEVLRFAVDSFESRTHDEVAPDSNRVSESETAGGCGQSVSSATFPGGSPKAANQSLKRQRSSSDAGAHAPYLGITGRRESSLSCHRTTKAPKCETKEEKFPIPNLAPVIVDPRNYTMSFGKHYGKKVDELPEDYLRWIIDKDVYHDHEDLAVTLRAHGYLDSGSSATIPSREALINFKAPERPTKGHFYDWCTHEKLWITDWDAKRYFKVDLGSMKQAGLVTWGKKNKKWWLFQVYAFAEHFGTIGYPSQTMRALRDFLNKNQVREEQIMGDLGLGLCCC